jgi:hypothetical protein
MRSNLFFPQKEGFHSFPFHGLDLPSSKGKASPVIFLYLGELCD